jgi:hypothetical protein
LRKRLQNWRKCGLDRSQAIGEKEVKHGKLILDRGDLKVSEVRFIPSLVHLYVTSKTEGYLFLTRKEARALASVLEDWVSHQKPSEKKR